MALISAAPASAQSFFTTLITDPVVGADRGSASIIRKLDEPTQFLTFSNTGSDAAGRFVLGYGLGHPDIATTGDQLDVSAVWAGPSKDGWRELLAGGVAYRFPVGLPDTTAFMALDYGDVLLGTPEALLVDARGDRQQIAVGLVHERALPNEGKLRFSGELIARRVNAEVLGFTSIDEELRTLRLSAQFSRGVPLLFQQRLAVSLSKGFDGFGASEPGNLLGSTPGATTDFLRVSFAAEASVPLSKAWVINAGLIGQWTDDSLPLSQRCGFETNAYARGFDYAVVLGDRCLGSRVEVAYNIILPEPDADEILFAQGFAGVDKGRVYNMANLVSPGGGDDWSSVSAGIRLLSGDFLGEVAVTQILDRPDVATDQDRDRLWFRMAVQF